MQNLLFIVANLSGRWKIMCKLMAIIISACEKNTNSTMLLRKSQTLLKTLLKTWLASLTFFYANNNKKIKVQKYLNYSEAYYSTIFILFFLILHFFFFIKIETLNMSHFLSVSLVLMSRSTRTRVSKLWSPWVADGRGRLVCDAWSK